MADRTWRDIEDVEVGEEVIGIDGLPNLVCKIEMPYLQGRALVNFEDGSLPTSAEHTVWSRKDGQEWFSSRDCKELAKEALMGLGADLVRAPFDNDAWEPMEYAHVNGFKKRLTYRMEAAPSTQLYQLVCNRSKTYIVNGWVVGSVPDDRTFDYAQIQWEKVVARCF